jgi:predicted dehydrogenase
MRKLRMGLVGGGPGSFIGRIHRLAAELDGDAQLVCGAFSSDPERSREAGLSYHVDPSRVYASYRQMMEKEKALPPDQRMDYVAVVTPNHLHYEPARLALEGGFHVVVDKPLSFSLKEAQSLQEIVKRTGQLLAVTYTYSGYPMVKEARSLIAQGAIGTVRKVFVEYSQGWLSTSLEKNGHKQADWRTDPARSGAGGAIGDIGTHAAHLAEYVSGVCITHLNALLNTVVQGRRLDDDCSILLRFDNGASGVLVATQVAAGEENKLVIRVYGEQGSFEWSQLEPNSLIQRSLDKPIQILRAGWNYLGAAAASNTRTPPGHPEGYLEAFANIYAAFHKAINARIINGGTGASEHEFPDVADGVRGMVFIEAVLRSALASEKWTVFK